MNWKNLVVTAFLGTSMALVGCGDDDGPSGTDTGTDTNMADGNGQDTNGGAELNADCADGACTFLVSVLSVDNGAGGGPVAGFNLDGEVSTNGGDTGCGKADFVNRFNSSIDGVDNQIAFLKGGIDAALMGDLNDTLSENIEAGELLLIMDLSGIDGADDSEVSGTVVLASLPDGATLNVTGGIPDAGQSFVTGDATPVTFNGSLTNGVFSASLNTLSLPLGDIGLDLRNVSVRMALTADAVSNGEIGGAAATEDVVNSLPEGQRAAAMALLGTNADMNITGNCDGVSAGVAFDAVSANLD